MFGFFYSNFPSRICCDFFRTTLFLEKQLLHTFSEWPLRHNSYIFGAAIFSEQLFFSPFSEHSLFHSSYFFQNSFFFRAKKTTEQPLLENKKFFMAVTFRNSYFFPVQDKDIQKRATFSKQVLLHSINFFKKVYYGKS